MTFVSPIVRTIIAKMDREPEKWEWSREYIIAKFSYGDISIDEYGYVRPVIKTNLIESFLLRRAYRRLDNWDNEQRWAESHEEIRKAFEAE